MTNKSSTNSDIVEAMAVRKIILKKMARDGGHVGSPLGVVEIVQALLHVYDFKKDKVIFDVGHQAHAYKILTDRIDKFDSLDKKDGIGIFPNIHESAYDFYTGGHSGLAVSAALGYAVNHPEYKSIAVLGDGSITGGQPYEALNHAGELSVNLLVIYNDNSHSINKNVGYLNAEKNLQKFSESLGFAYVGIIDGHHVASLVKELKRINDIKKPVFLHVKTVKGKGYKPAEQDPVTFHSIPPFDLKTGLPNKQETNVFKDYFLEKAERLINESSSLYFTSPAAARSSGLADLQKLHPTKVFDTGMNEQHCVTFSAAIALNNSKVVCFLPAIFMPRAFDQIIDVAIGNIPVVFVILNPGITNAGPTHQGIYTFSTLQMLPNVEIYNPANLHEFDVLLDEALQKKCPVFIQKPAENVLTDLSLSNSPVSIVVMGSALTVVSVGNMLAKALATSSTIKGVEVIHLRRVKPLDLSKIAASVKKTKRLLILEDGCVYSGVGQNIVTSLSNTIDFKHEIMGVKEAFPKVGTLDDVHTDLGLSIASIKSTALKLLA